MRKYYLDDRGTTIEDKRSYLEFQSLTMALEGGVIQRRERNMRSSLGYRDQERFHVL